MLESHKLLNLKERCKITVLKIDNNNFIYNVFEKMLFFIQYGC